MSDLKRVCVFRLAFGTAILVALSGCASESTEEDSRTVAGAWIQVYPAIGALEELTLRPDGFLEGSVAGLDTLIRPLTRWKIGNGPMPDGLCVGNSRTWLCQGFELIGDTLWLANGTQTTYLRAHHAAAPLRAWDSPQYCSSYR